MTLTNALTKRRLSRSGFTLTAVASLVAACCASLASATSGTLDQSYTATPSGTGFISASGAYAQVFTAGMTGRLTEISAELQTNGTATGTVTIVPFVSGSPVWATTLGTGSIPTGVITSSTGWIDVVLTSPAQVTAGQQYVLVISTTGTGSNAINWSEAGNGYSGGNGWYETCCGDRGFDFDFATYVTPPDPVVVSAPRGAYCTAAGDTSDSGIPWAAGTFVNLDDGQVNTDPSYHGATMAIFVAGKGLTCDPPPSGYTRRGFASEDLGVDGNTYPYYSL